MGDNETPAPEEAREETWRQRLHGFFEALGGLLSTRAAIFREELGASAAALGSAIGSVLPRPASPDRGNRGPSFPPPRRSDRRNPGHLRSLCRGRGIGGVPRSEDAQARQLRVSRYARRDPEGLAGAASFREPPAARTFRRRGRNGVRVSATLIRRSRGAVPGGVGMTSREERLAALMARGREERESLAAATADVRAEIERRRAQWKLATMLATGAAAAGTIAYKLFGSASLAVRLGRSASVLSLVIGLLRAFQKVRRFF